MVGSLQVKQFHNIKNIFSVLDSNKTTTIIHIPSSLESYTDITTALHEQSDIFLSTLDNYSYLTILTNENESSDYDSSQVVVYDLHNINYTENLCEIHCAKRLNLQCSDTYM